MIEEPSPQDQQIQARFTIPRGLPKRGAQLTPKNIKKQNWFMNHMKTCTQAKSRTRLFGEETPPFLAALGAFVVAQVAALHQF